MCFKIFLLIQQVRYLSTVVGNRTVDCGRAATVDSRCCSGVDCAAERASLCRHAGMYPCPQITWCPVGRSPGSPSPSCTTPPPCKYHHIITSRTPPHWLSLARNSPHFTRANAPRVFRRGLLQRTVCCESFMEFSQFSIEN